MTENIEKENYMNQTEKETTIIDGKEYTYEQAHRMLWNEIAENMYPSKWYFFKNHEIEKRPKNHCYACQSSRSEEDINFCDCSKCPIHWHLNSNKDLACETMGSLYYRWKKYVSNGQLKKASKIARRIAQIKWHTVTI